MLTAILVTACQGDSIMTGPQASVLSGNADGAKACQGTGYKSLKRPDGSSFKNVGDCVSYAAQGGTFGPSISSFVLNRNDCFFGTYTAVFSGGVGTVGGQTVTSGEAFTINTLFTQPVLTVTSSSGATVTSSAPYPQYDSTCLL